MSRVCDDAGSILGGEVVPAGTGHEAVAERLLDQPGAASLRVRDVVFGCYVLTVQRDVRA